MAHTNHMRYSNNVIGKDDPQPNLFVGEPPVDIYIFNEEKGSTTIPFWV